MGNFKSKPGGPSTPEEELTHLMGKPVDVLKKSHKLFKLGREEYKNRNLKEAHRYFELAYLYLRVCLPGL